VVLFPHIGQVVLRRRRKGRGEGDERGEIV